MTASWGACEASWTPLAICWTSQGFTSVGALLSQFLCLADPDPFNSDDDGASCMRCGYLIESSRERRGLMTCAECG